MEQLVHDIQKLSKPMQVVMLNGLACSRLERQDLAFKLWYILSKGAEVTDLIRISRRIMPSSDMPIIEFPCILKDDVDALNELFEQKKLSGSEKESLLLGSAACGSYNCFTYLLDHNVTSLNLYKYAIFSGKEEIFMLLIDKGVKSDKYDLHNSIRLWKNYFALTFVDSLKMPINLEACIKYGNYSFFVQMIDRGIDYTDVKYV